MATLLIIGLSIASLLYILSAGLTLIFGMLGVVNFAHGALYMVGAFVAYQCVAWTGSLWPAFVAAPLAVGLLGLLLEVATLRPIYRHAHHYQLLLTFGAILVLDELVRLVWGISYRNVPTPAALAGSIGILGVELPAYRLFVIACGAAVFGTLWLLIGRSRFGVVVRAASVNPDMTACMGVDVARVRSTVFAAGSALAALGGVIAAPLLPVLPGMGTNVILECFVVVVIGGLGNLQGALLGALMLGLANAIGQQYLPEWINVLTYAILLATLLLKPEGLLAVRTRAA